MQWKNLYDNNKAALLAINKLGVTSANIVYLDKYIPHIKNKSNHTYREPVLLADQWCV